MSRDIGFWANPNRLALQPSMPGRCGRNSRHEGREEAVERVCVYERVFKLRASTNNLNTTFFHPTTMESNTDPKVSILSSSPDLTTHLGSYSHSYHSMLLPARQQTSEGIQLPTRNRPLKVRNCSPTLHIEKIDINGEMYPKSPLSGGLRTPPACGSR